MDFSNLEVKRIDHHGIVAGVIHDLGIASSIDELIGTSSNENISVGEAVSAMIINGLGFTDQPLSLTEEFFAQLPTETLIGEGVSPDSLNRHRLGRALDSVFSYGTSEIFGELAKRAAIKDQVDVSQLALDTTSFNVTGEYDDEYDSGAIEVVHGYSKDHRPDLKQIVTELIVSHDSGIPLVFKAHSGNKSDNEIFKQRCKDIVNHFKENSDSLLSADSKLYNKENAENLKQINFITRKS